MTSSESVGIPLMPSVARSLIEEILPTRVQWKRSDLAAEVEKIHLERGGTKGRQDRQRIVKKALSVLEEEGKVDSPAYGQWRWINESVPLNSRSAESAPSSTLSGKATEAQIGEEATEPEDPTQRIGRLASANTKPVTVNPHSKVDEAVTLMILHDYSQLPVMQGDRALKGAVTWQSIGRALSLGRPAVTVSDCLENVIVIDSTASLFSAIPSIVERGFVLVRSPQNTIAGIVTTADLSLQFRQLAEPFLLLGEIEMHLRRLGHGKFSKEEIQTAKDPNDTSRAIRDLADLSFGEHVRLVENPGRWSALGLRIDRGTFVNQLNEIRDIRNDVMHFDPDGTDPSDLERLRRFVRLLGALAA